MYNVVYNVEHYVEHYVEHNFEHVTYTNTSWKFQRGIVVPIKGVVSRAFDHLIFKVLIFKVLIFYFLSIQNVIVVFSFAVNKSTKIQIYGSSGNHKAKWTTNSLFDRVWNDKP